nr:MAG TPA: hypothetical protein [Caudoviricetes sp.]
MQLLKLFCQFFYSIIRFVILIIKYSFSYSPCALFLWIRLIWAIPFITPYNKLYLS